MVAADAQESTMLDAGDAVMIIGSAVDELPLLLPIISFNDEDVMFIAASLPLLLLEG